MKHTKYPICNLLFVGLSGATMFFLACNTLTAGTTTPIASLPAIDFLLDASSFPSGWEASPCDTSLCQDNGDEIDAAERDFFLSDAPGHAFQEVYRFPSEQLASDKFQVYREGNFNESEAREPFVPFEPPIEVKFQNKFADEYFFACGVDVIPQCKMLARYQNYFIYFYFDRATEDELGGLTYKEIETVLEAVDNKAANLLNIQN